MDQFLYYGNIFLDAFKNCWAELIGSFLMAIMTNLLSIKGTQKEIFKLISFGFYTIILKDIVSVVFQLLPVLAPQILFPKLLPSLTDLCFVSLVTAFFITGAFRNIRIYFSPWTLVLVLTALLTGISLFLTLSDTLWNYGLYLSSIYMMAGFFTMGLSFYVNQSGRQNAAVRTLGNGFIVLTLCYGYQLYGLVANIQQVTLLCYTIVIVLSLAAQVQLLNLETQKLSYRLEVERRSKREIWEVSPFPVILSRLRDDTIVYMNPAAQKIFMLNPAESTNYPFSAFFAQQEDKDKLLNLLHNSPIVQSFEAEVHHPQKDNNFWIDLMTRITDLDEEIILFSTFKDITDQKRVKEILEEQASTDPLTGLYNRRQFEILAYQGLQTARRYNLPYSIAMLDIDFFKKVNDTYGHEAGDIVLKKLADILKDTLRKSDVIARYGGEEFVVFLANTTPSDAEIAIEHVRDNVEKADPIVDGKTIHFTVSAGISDDQAGTLNTLIKHADEALYASKENGRNQITQYCDLRRFASATNEEKPSDDQDKK